MLQVPGRNFNVHILYAPVMSADYMKAAAHHALNIHHEERFGDVLIFLTGEEEVERCCSLISDSIGDQDAGFRCTVHCRWRNSSVSFVQYGVANSFARLILRRHRSPLTELFTSLIQAFPSRNVSSLNSP